MDVIAKEFTYKGYVKTFTVAVPQMVKFDPKTMTEEEYEAAKKECFIIAEAELYDQKTEWVFRIEMGLEPMV